MFLFTFDKTLGTMGTINTDTEEQTMKQQTIINVIIAAMALGASVMPVAIFGLFHTNSIAYHVTKAVFSLN